MADETDTRLDPRREPARARRRRDRDRMVSRAHRVFVFRLNQPVRAVAPDLETARDMERRGLAADWASVARLRESFARRHADHLATCSCWMCGNPRRLGERTLQERIADELGDFEDLEDFEGFED